MTTHLLSRKVEVNGIIELKDGFREFAIILDRTSDHRKEIIK